MTQALVLTAAFSARAEELGGTPLAEQPPGAVRAKNTSAEAEPEADAALVRELAEAALREAGLDARQAGSWPRRAHLAPLLPELRVRAAHQTRLQAASGSGDIGGGTGLEERIGWSVDASVSWSLERLVFSRDELQGAREAREVAARRSALRAEVTRLYFQRRRLALELAQNPPSKPGARLELGLRIAELGALLDGLTGGAWSRQGTRPR